MQSESFKFTMKIKEDILIKVYKLSTQDNKDSKNNKMKYKKKMLKKLENTLSNNKFEIITAANETLHLRISFYYPFIQMLNSFLL